MYIKTRVFSFKFVNKYYSTLDPLLVSRKMRDKVRRSGAWW